MGTICGHSFEEYKDMVTRFHCYHAPGVLIGGFMVDLALEQRPSGEFYEVLCETQVCLPDAVQLLTPCTFGNGWLKIADVGRFALTLFDKKTGAGVRVHIDTKKLDAFPEIKNWFFKLKSKKEQDMDRLLTEINAAGRRILGSATVQVAPEFIGPHKSGDTAPCPSCGEAYPVRDGDRCQVCQGRILYQG
jgi:formylmethanofuran dehydrogenase subunit E